MLFNNHGYLTAGFHYFSFAKFKESFVDRFETSFSRQDIFISLENLLKSICAVCLPVEIWIDGSYVTNKVNPNDIDIVCFLEYDVFVGYRTLLNEIIKKDKNVDIYFAHSICDKNKNHFSNDDFDKINNNRNYWRGQFGFDRSDEPKGIICFEADSLKIYSERSE